MITEKYSKEDHRKIWSAIAATLVENGAMSEQEARKTLPMFETYLLIFENNKADELLEDINKELTAAEAKKVADKLIKAGYDE